MNRLPVTLMAILSLAIGISNLFPSNGLPIAQNLMRSSQTYRDSTHRDSRASDLPTTIALDFGLDPIEQTSKPRSLTEPNPTHSIAPDSLFQGGPDSLVARAIGSAEGTRRPDGSKNSAYYGHRDPGNAKWNLGSFSYQHDARSPEDADQRQLNRLQTQDKMLHQLAAARGLQMTLQERLNGLDLANQAPLAALDRGGYIDRLKEARDRGLQGEKAILYARVNSYRLPDSNLWDAPGLGNNETDIRNDQARRMEAVEDAIALAQK